VEEPPLGKMLKSVKTRVKTHSHILAWLSSTIIMGVKRQCGQCLHTLLESFQGFSAPIAMFLRERGCVLDTVQD
jgi:hypothetical protein